MEIRKTDRVKNEVLNKDKKKRNVTHTIKLRLTGLVTLCVETTFKNTLLDGRKKG